MPAKKRNTFHRMVVPYLPWQAGAGFPHLSADDEIVKERPVGRNGPRGVIVAAVATISLSSPGRGRRMAEFGAR